MTCGFFSSCSVAAACSPPPEAPPLAKPAESIQRDSSLVIDGETIADPELWKAAQDEGELVLYSGYTQDSEATVLEQFEADTGLKVKLIRTTSAVSLPAPTWCGSPMRASSPGSASVGCSRRTNHPLR